MRKILRLIAVALMYIGIEALYSQQETFDVTPNPFKSVTNLNFSLVQDGKININVYNVVGQKVGINIQDSFFASGSHTIVLNGDTLGDGIYIMQLIVGTTKFGRKVVKSTSSSSITKTFVQKNDLLIFPIPAIEIVTIVLPQEMVNKSCKAIISDLTGRVVALYQLDQSDNQYNLQTSILENGNYIITLESGIQRYRNICMVRH